MKKSMYSLILSDNIVAAVDTLASDQGSSRSAFVNHILAEFTNLSTPEQHLQDTYAVVQQNISSHLRGSVSPGGALTLRTSLRYKYNPQLNYVLEITPEEETLGQLRINLRSQNAGLLDVIQKFFILWRSLEQKYLPHPPAPTQQQLEEKRYTRWLRLPKGLSDAQVGKAIGVYISLLDTSIKTYFQNLSNMEIALDETEKLYRRMLPTLGIAVDL